MKPFLILFCCLLAGCSLFTSYPQQVDPAMAAMEEGRFTEALEALPQDPGGPDELLYYLERGLIAHVQGDFATSNAEFFKANEVLKGFADRPTISLRGNLEGATSLILNEKTLPYDGEGFERVLLHVYLALNFYFLRQYDDAFVEVRLAYQEQRAEEQRMENTYGGQGAFARYVSGIVREVIGEPGEAYIDYKKVAELAPQCQAVQLDLLRLARRLGYDDDLKIWQGKFNVTLDQLPTEPSTGECVIFYQCGKAPVKRPIEIPVPFVHGITELSFPDYEPRTNPIAKLRVLASGQILGTTELLEDVESIAMQNLKDRIALVIAKASVRAAGKAVVTDQLAREYGPLAAILGSIFNLVSEQADLRSWLSLPRNFQILRKPLSPGTYEFTVELLDQVGKVVGVTNLGKIKLREAERIVFNIRTIGYANYFQIVGGEINE